MEYGPVREFRGDAVSSSQTTRALEASNLPAVLIGGVEKWPAISLWDPAKGGLQYLKGLAGSTTVQAITSNTGSAFYGHIRGHDRVVVSFDGFIDRITSGCGSCLPEATEGSDTVISGRDTCVDKVGTNIDNTRDEGEQALLDGALDGQLYLAQVPIFSKEAVQEATLSSLMRDISIPSVLESNRVSDINLWMSMADSRSSTHYDPYHNLLCVVTGEKKVTLWPPSAAPFLYPLAVNGEASNHSGVDFVQPDYKAHPLFKKAVSLAQNVTLHPGDALFIPEGWYHQVDNSGPTIAVNFWWPSKVSLALGTHMDGYFLRRTIVTLVDHEKDRILGEILVQRRKPQQPLPLTGAYTSRSTPAERLDPDIARNEEERETVKAPQSELNKLPTYRMKLGDLTAGESCSLKILIENLSRHSADSPDSMSEVGDSANGLEDDWESSLRSNGGHKDHLQEISRAVISRKPQQDSIARVFSRSTALSLRRILLVMVNHFPRMLETLMLTCLSPLAAEILTRKFDELDASTEKSSQAEFYEQFYRAFDNPDAVMEALLDGKEAFSAQALRNVLTDFLGVSCTLGSSHS